MYSLNQKENKVRGLLNILNQKINENGNVLEREKEQLISQQREAILIQQLEEKDRLI